MSSAVVEPRSPELVRNRSAGDVHGAVLLLAMAPLALRLKAQQKTRAVVRVESALSDTKQRATARNHRSGPSPDRFPCE